MILFNVTEGETGQWTATDTSPWKYKIDLVTGYKNKFNYGDVFDPFENFNKSTFFSFA